MKTIQMTLEEMKERTARFAELDTIPAMKNDKIPQQAADLIYSRKLLPVISPEGVDNPFGALAPIQGAAGMSMIIAMCPPNQGPSLHAHHKTYETFTVLDGQFKFTWGDKGEHSVVLSKFDTLSVPPGICRAFCNVGDREGILQVVITGGIHDRNDIAFPPIVAEQVKKVGPGILEEFEKTGLKFNAGVE